MEFELGQTYSGYKFLEVASRSRHGVEYRVQNTLVQRLELLKVLPLNAQDDRDEAERFLCEVRRGDAAAFEALLDVPRARIGEVSDDDRLRISPLADSAAPVVDAKLADLKEAWQQPLRWE